MRWRRYGVLSTLFVLCLTFNAWLYGSLAREPEVGPALASSARANAPLLHTYIVLGDPLAAYTGASGQRMADAAFADAYPSIVASPATARQPVVHPVAWAMARLAGGVVLGHAGIAGAGACSMGAAQPADSLGGGHPALRLTAPAVDPHRLRGRWCIAA